MAVIVWKAESSVVATTFMTEVTRCIIDIYSCELEALIHDSCLTYRFWDFDIMELVLQTKDIDQMSMPESCCVVGPIARGDLLENLGDSLGTYMLSV